VLRRGPFACFALAVAFSLGGCGAPETDNSELEGRVAELEDRLLQLEERLASVPDHEGLEEASAAELAIRLGREDVVSRFRAVKELSRRHPEDVQQLLFEVIASGRGKEREGAAAVFALAADPGATSRLLLLHGEEKEPRVRSLLALGLGRAGGSEAAEALMADLDHESRTVRLAAVQALDRLGAAEAGGRLLVAALDADVHVASAARGTLQRLPATAFQFVVSEWDWIGPRKRVDAIELIGTLEGERAQRFLRERVADPDPLVALAASRELALRGDPAGRNLALQRLRSDDPVIARAARGVLDAFQMDP
jgi:HEAT repeat protein